MKKRTGPDGIGKLEVDEPVSETERQAILSRLQQRLRAAQQREAVTINEDQKAALKRLLTIARRDTGQSRRCADFLLAWHNGAENGGWNPADLWSVDREIADDMMTVLGLIHGGPTGKYPNDWGFRAEIEAVWDQWRGGKDVPDPEAFDEKDNRYKWPEDRR